MGVIWIICGASRGVGKTYLAMNLCRILPNSVYAKCGCGQKKADQPANFFNTQNDLELFVTRYRDSYEHIVIESNTRARAGKGDVIIFLDCIDGNTNIRNDVEQLQSMAHISVSTNILKDNWKTVLEEKLQNRILRKTIYELLDEQKRFLENQQHLSESKT
jgi:hypothetical protein